MTAGGALILNVDDNESIRTLRTLVLRDAQFTVIEAANGPDAIALSAQHQPALVLLDVNLPGGLDGFETCRRLKAPARGKAPAVVHISADATSADAIVTGLEAGSDTYLVEPIQAEVLVGVIGAVLRRAQAEQAARAALERSEQRYRALVDDAVLPIFETTLDGTLRMANPAFARMMGEDAPAALIGLNVHGWYRDPAVRDRVIAGFVTSQSEHQEADWERPDGGALRVRIGGRRVDTSDGPVYQALAEDVSEQHRAECERRQAQKMEAIGRLAGGIAHDFNNMLTAILGFSDMLLEQLGDSPIAGDLREIKHAAERAAEMTRGLLAFSRKQMLTIEAFAVDDLLGETEGLYKRLIGEQVQLQIEPGAPAAVIRVDRSRLEQVLLNLVVNARDAMPAGGKVTVSTAIVELDAAFAATHPPLKPGPHVTLRVSDTGIGMSADVRQHIFEPFFTTKGQGGGTGLGLATVYGIVKQMRGWIDIESVEGVGTTVTIYFAAAADVKPAEREARRALPGIGHQKILLVEDEPGVRRFAELCLTRHGFSVLPCGSGQDALAQLDALSGAVDLLISDIVMPTMTGAELARAAQHRYPKLPVLLMSGYAANQLRISRGCRSDFELLEKPFSSSALLEKVLACLGSSSSPRT